jgi:threonine dehydrogenase-like Zn-dependent dehydrogenase
VLGLGPIGQMSCRIAAHRGAARVIGVDLVPERLELARRYGIETIGLDEVDDVVQHLRELTDGRGPDAVIDAVGMEAHGAPVAELMQKATARLPNRVGAALAERAGIDRLSALSTAIQSVRRGGTLSIIGVYGGRLDPLPMMELFDKGVQIRMGQAHVKRWIPDLLPLVSGDDDPLGTEDLATHVVPLAEAPHAYEIFQKKEDGAIKVLLTPQAA